MRSWVEIWWIWRRHLWIWVPAAAFLVVNLIGFSAYRLLYADQMDIMERRVATQQDRLAELESLAAERRDALARAIETWEGLQELYEEGFSTERRRLTQIIEEVKDLARRAGLVPDSISYPEEQIEDFGLVKKSFAFSVEGSYVDLRKFINFLELSGSFLTLEEIGLSEAEARRGRLRISLRLSTLFVEEPRRGVTG